MTPRRDRWVDFDRPYAPRRAVEGGVAVSRPGKVTSAEPARLVALAEGRTTSGIASRGRTYARAGQVVEVRLDGGTASAAIQGSDAAPYAVSLVHGSDGAVEATCTCPYGCDAVEWCKHAAALAYVVAHLVDADARLAAEWAGDGAAHDAAAGRAATTPSTGGTTGTASVPGTLGPEEAADLVRALRTPPAPVDARAQWRAAVEVLALP